MLSKQRFLYFDQQVFAQQFEIDKCVLGKGFDSTVVRVYEKSNPRQFYALKLTNYKDPQHKYNFQQEIKLLHCINHPNIIQFYGNSVDGTCILIEYMPYGNLAKLADLDIKFVKTIMIQIMQAVQYLHQNNVVHADLKPENVLISADFNLKLCDFGFARYLQDGNGRINGGSEGYSAPEIITQMQYDPKKCDVFSIGVMLFVLYLGHRPFLTNHPQKEDKYWNLIKTKSWDKYWSVFKQAKKIDEGFKRYFEKLMEINNQNRCSIQEAISDPWLQNEASTLQELQNHISDKLQIKV